MAHLSNAIRISVAVAADVMFADTEATITQITAPQPNIWDKIEDMNEYNEENMESDEEEGNGKGKGNGKGNDKEPLWEKSTSNSNDVWKMNSTTIWNWNLTEIWYWNNTMFWSSNESLYYHWNSSMIWNSEESEAISLESSNTEKQTTGSNQNWASELISSMFGFGSDTWVGNLLWPRFGCEVKVTFVPAIMPEVLKQNQRRLLGLDGHHRDSTAHELRSMDDSITLTYDDVDLQEAILNAGEFVTSLANSKFHEDVSNVCSYPFEYGSCFRRGDIAVV